MAASDFWDQMDTNIVPKEEIELYVSCLVNGFRRSSMGPIGERFLRKTNIKEVKEVDEVVEQCEKSRMQTTNGMDFWPFLFQKALKEKRLRDASQADEQAMDAEEDVVFSDEKVAATTKLYKYFYAYVNKNIYKTVAAGKPKKRKGSLSKKSRKSKKPNGESSKSKILKGESSKSKKPKGENSAQGGATE